MMDSAEFERVLDRFLPLRDCPQKKLLEAMRYSLLNGGKRVRARLMLMSAEMFSLSPEPVWPYAAALEMIHAYSLIHDDLPAMDNDDMRRGKPSSHIVYGEGLAILAGDGLLNTAMEILLSQCRNGTPYTEASLYLARQAGISGMIGGQCVDLELTGRVSQPVPDEALQFLQDRKTAALLRASVVIPAILSSGTAEAVKAAERFGTALGHVFQIVDDLLDVKAEACDLGKSTGKDRRDGKITAVAVYGYESACQKAKEWNRLAEDALEQLEAMSYRTEELRQFTDSLLHRNK